jgi:hypothetical protein
MIPHPSRLTKFVLCIILASLTSVLAHATIFTFKPNDGEGDTDDMFDLDHYKYYTWGFSGFVVPTGEKITSAKLTISDINNWTADENGTPVYKKVNGRYVYVNGKKVVDYYLPENWLNIWLLDGLATNKSSTSGKLTVYSDIDGGPDYFSAWNNSSPLKKAAKIATYTDWSGGTSGDVVTLSYDFATYGVLDELEAYLATSNNFGLGFDPDCHYWNTGVKLVIETSRYNVPDTASSLGLAGMGFASLALLRRRLRS